MQSSKLTRPPTRLVIILNGAVPYGPQGAYLHQNEMPFYKRLAEEFSEVRIVGDYYADRAGANYIQITPDDNITFIRAANARWPRLGRYIQGFIRSMLEVVRARRAMSSIYIHYPSRNGAFAAAFSRLIGLPYNLYVRVSVPLTGLQGYLNRANLRGANYCLVTGSWLLSRVARFNPNSELVVPMMNVKPEDLVLSDVEPTVEHPSKLLFIGRPTIEKGVHIFIQALRSLRDNDIAVVGKIIGSLTTSEQRILEQEIAELGLQECVTYVPGAPPEAIRIEISEATALILPSGAEGFPRVIYEALTLGTPVIAYNLPNYEGFLVDGENALLCGELNPEAFACAAHQLLHDPLLARKLSAEGRRTMHKFFLSFSADSHADQLLRVVIPTSS